MNVQQQLQLEDAQQKLSIFRKHLDLLARCTGESKNVDPHDVLSAVSELQSLVEWAAQQPELGEESAVLLVKLQELHRIRENLEKTSKETGECSESATNKNKEVTIPEHSESAPDESKEIAILENSELAPNEVKEIVIPENSESAPNEDKGIAVLEISELAPNETEETVIPENSELAPNKAEEIAIPQNSEAVPNEAEGIAVVEISESAPNKAEAIAIPKNFESVPSEADGTVILENPETTPNGGEDIAIPENFESYSKNLENVSDNASANLCDNNGENNNEDDSVSMDKDSLGDYSASIEDQNVANAESPDSIEDSNVDFIPSDDKMDQSVNLDENEESNALNEDKDAKEALEENMDVQETSSESKTEICESPSIASELRSPDLFRSEVIIIETDEDNKSTEWIDNSKSSNDPLDVCMYAIRNLYESLRVKENELLKLSAMQNDQKHIEALQAVIIEFHKDITNLNSELEKSQKENIVLKEQVLELEEAENDARLEAQKLEQKLVFLQEKDSHSQAELTQLKQNLKKANETLAEKETQEKELRSEIKYMEALVQKYEDQIKVMESKETSNLQKNPETQEVKNDTKKPEKQKMHTKGTQTYEPRQIKINANGEPSDNNNNVEINLIANQKNEVFEGAKNTVNNSAEDGNASADEITQTKEKDGFANIESISQKELLQRLHKLIDEDVSLQQQIHYVDEINLAMWKKLQNLDTHIGECKRQNINETNPAVAEEEHKMPGCESSETEVQETSATTTSENIPEEKLSCLDQNEQYIQERLAKLEEVNASFEKELKTRENLYKEREKKSEEWIETEKRIKDDLKKLAEEKDWITDQITKLNREKEAREKVINQLEEEINALKEKNQAAIAKVKADQESITDPLNFKVNQMLTKEKEILKMITNLKSEKNRSYGKSELERLKCNYIELQLELSQAREEMRKLEEQFKLKFDQWANQHILEEAQRASDLDRLRNENCRNDKIISNLQMKQKGLINALEKQESYLQQTRESYEKNLEVSEEEHRSVETELKSQLQQIEEGTAIATTALMEERMKVEKELHQNIEDLKAKEEIYKTKIAGLERDVIHLHDELHKIETESKKEVTENQDTAEFSENPIEVPFSKTEDAKNFNQNAPQSTTVVSNLKPSEKIVVRQSISPIKTEVINSLENKESVVEKDVTEDNVDELRAQVLELQSDLEKISQEAADMPPVQPLKPITTSSLKMQKVEDIDYAEVDECCFDAYKKNLQNMTASAPNSQNFQGGYGNKYSPRYKNIPQNQRASVEEPVEENDYDEVLPRPTNFHVVQQVGPDTLLVGWNYVNPSVLDGFEVYLGDQVHERIYIPDRTKALISGLNLKKPIHLSICALSRYGQMSEPTTLELPSAHELNTQYFEDEDDEYRDFEDPTKRNHRPYSMEW